MWDSHQGHRSWKNASSQGGRHYPGHHHGDGVGAGTPGGVHHRAPVGRTPKAAPHADSEPLEPRRLLAFSAAVNFQPADAPVPTGYLVDSGAPFADRGNGYQYGWNRANNNARDRQTLPDQRYDTLNHMQKTSGLFWELAVPNGTYAVTISAGDPDFINSTFKIDAEGAHVVDGRPTSGSRFVEGTATVTVTDGRLTLTNAAGSFNNKINFVTVNEVVAAAPTAAPTNAPTNAPVQLLAAAAPVAPTLVVSAAATKINFQPASAPVVQGYLVDSGATFGNRGNGYRYGWNLNNSYARDRDRVTDQRYDTLNHLQKKSGLYWELAVPNGTYSVHLVAGDASATDSVFAINVEGVLTVNGRPSSRQKWVEGTSTVTVTDGRLTVTNAPGSSNNKINYIEVMPITTTPVAPGDFAATLAGTNQVRLTWTDTSTTETGWQLERAENGGSFSLRSTLPPNTTTYTDTVTDGKTYQYRLTLLTAVAGLIATANAQVLVPLAAPTHLTATPAANVPKVTLSWSNQSANAAGYVVAMSQDGQTFTTVATLPATATSYTVATGLLPATAYTFRVFAYAGEARSAVATAVAETADFQVFDATTSAAVPDLSDYGFNGIVVGYEWAGSNSPRSMLTADKSAAVEANVKYLATEASRAGVPLVLDVESWPLMPSSTVSKATAKANLRRIIQMINWAREGHPDLPVGFYGFPHPSYGNYQSDSARAALRSSVEFWNGSDPDTKTYDASHDLFSNLDFLSPSLYARNSDLVAWETICDVIMSEATRVARSYDSPKPVFPFVWMEYEFTADPETGSSWMGEQAWRYTLSERRRDSDGVVVWGAPGMSWDNRAGWWAATQAFLDCTGAAPAAPTGLAVEATGMRLNWTDRSDNEGGFVIERSTNGADYVAVGQTLPDVTSWIDASYQAGTRYWYRVRAIDGVCQSATTSAVSAVATRDAFAINEVENFDGTNRDWRYATGVSVSGGSWLRYGAVDFSRGASSVTLGIGLEDQGAGRSVEIWIDALDSGTKIGQRTLDVAGGWGDISQQTVAVTPVTGVHDLYFRFVGGASGTSPFDWFAAQ